ncbi:sugar transferase [candidate division KSB1 bacterium]|nr:sugar transferase [candidate division KSB1 bacterium]
MSKLQLNPKVFEFKRVNVITRNWKLFAFRIKRIIDIFCAIICIIVLFPLMVLIALGIKVTSSGPMLFTQHRLGYRGKVFTFLKFRTMVHNCDDLVHREFVKKLIKGETQSRNFNNRLKPLYKFDNDLRVTRFGRFLRAWSLDELPQLFHVIKGDMGLVGPRPPLPYEVEYYNKWQMQRLEVKPGITGLWQVKGRSRTTFDEMVKLDIQYVNNWSLWLDFKILLRTFKAVISREGAL